MLFVGAWASRVGPFVGEPWVRLSGILDFHSHSQESALVAPLKAILLANTPCPTSTTWGLWKLTGGNQKAFKLSLVIHGIRPSMTGTCIPISEEPPTLKRYS